MWNTLCRNQDDANVQAQDFMEERPVSGTGKGQVELDPGEHETIESIRSMPPRGLQYLRLLLDPATDTERWTKWSVNTLVRACPALVGIRGGQR